jgi:multidrug efflux pump subunit AcrA (membrane-fusion protein)
VIPTNRNPLAGSIAAVSLALLGGCNRMTPVKAAVDEPALVRVSAVRVEKRDLARGAELAAEFRPYQEVDVHAKVAGYLKNITVDVGDRVAQGRVIGTLEVPEYAQEMAHASALEKRSELDVAKSRAEVLRAQSAFDLRKVSYERLMAASKARPKLIAQQELDNAAALYRGFRRAAGAGERRKQRESANDDELSPDRRALQRSGHPAVRGYGCDDPGGHSLADTGDAGGSDRTDRPSSPGASRSGIDRVARPHRQSGRGSGGLAPARLPGQSIEIYRAAELFHSHDECRGRRG